MNSRVSATKKDTCPRPGNLSITLFLCVCVFLCVFLCVCVCVSFSLSLALILTLILVLLLSLRLFSLPLVLDPASSRSHSFLLPLVLAPPRSCSHSFSLPLILALAHYRSCSLSLALALCFIRQQKFCLLSSPRSSYVLLPPASRPKFQLFCTFQLNHHGPMDQWMDGQMDRVTKSFY